MGTTGTALVTDNAVKLQWVAVIEGVEYLITDGSTSAATTAWAATDWTSAVGGLQINWSGNTQTMEPFSPAPMTTRISFGVMDTSATRADTIGVMVGRTGGGVETFLNETLTVSDTTISCLSTANFAASGTIHIGTEAIAYTGKTGTTFTGCTRGKWAPLSTNSGTANRFGRYHPLPAVGAGFVTKPKISSVQRTWVGRWVAIYAHRNVAGVLDTKAQAQLVWAGRLLGTRDEANGMTWFECESATSAIKDCVLMRDQWFARVQEGIYLAAGSTFDIGDSKAGSALYANQLDVVASGASGSNEINAGVYTLPDLLSELNEWMAAEKVAARLNFNLSFEHLQVDESTRVSLQITNGSTTGTNIVQFTCPARISDFLGFTLNGIGGYGAGLAVIWDDLASFSAAGSEEPYRTYVQPWQDQSGVLVDNEQGTFFDNEAMMTPDMVATAAIVSGTPGVIQFGDDGPIMVCGYAAGTLDVRQEASWYNPGGFFRLPNARWSQGEITVRQVGVIYGPFAETLTKILASTGTAAYNHATYDAYPAPLGAAIPYEILGAGWLARAQAIGAGTGDLMIVIEKPTPLLEVLGADLVARFVQLGWKGSGSSSTAAGLRLLGWGTPSTSTSSYALTESNKARPIDAQDNLVTAANDSDQFLCNEIVLKYNRQLGTDDYASTISIRDPASQYDHGTARSVTIKLRNTYDGVDATTGWISTLVESLSVAMGMFSKPRRILRRTIDQQAFDGLAPGDTVTLNDDFARDPTTGARGLSSKAGLIVSHRAEWPAWENDTQGSSNISGEVDLLILPQDKVYAYSPTAEIASYVAGTKVATCVANRHSETSDTVNTDAGRFAVGDKVRWVEIDPDTAAAPATDVDTIAGVGTNTLTLTTGITGYSASLTYRIISDDYSTAVSTQKAQAYIADDDDNMVLDAIDAYQYGYDVNNATTGTAIGPGGFKTFRYHNTLMYTQGEPLDTGSESDALKNAQCLVDHRTAVNGGQLYRTVMTDAGSYVKRILAVEPFYIGPGHQNGIYRRKLYVRPWLRSTSGASVKLWVSLCRNPPSGTSMSTTDADAPDYQLGTPYVRAEWSVSSTTAGVGALTTLNTNGIAPEDGICYIVIEGETNVETRGLAMCQLGPRETS